MNYIKDMPTQVSQTVVNLVFTMAKGDTTTKAQFKREIKGLSKDLFNLDLQIQDIRTKANSKDQIKRLEKAKYQVQQDVIAKQIALELLDAQSHKARGRH